ncbi:MAG TPA: glycosyltransferase [Chitinophagales bacterium]|jgi:glycosyltransferase involved in cell wall biosynthesis|nr:glycosyltransferase [Chitinophagales bacterium]
MQLKHIYWFGYYNNSVPSIRYRALQPLAYCKTKFNITYNFVYPSYHPLQILHFIYIYFSALLNRKQNSIIVFQKIYTNGIYARMLKYLLKKQPHGTIYDIDDAEYVRRPVDTIHHFMNHCSACTVGSAALKAYAEKYNKHVYLLTSPIVYHHHIKHQKNTEFTIGWIGYYGAHYNSLNTYILPVITQFPFPVHLIILGITDAAQLDALLVQFAPYKHITITAPLHINWLDEASIYSHILQFDVGIAPLLDTEFNRAKSAYKMKQYLSCGIPVTASPVGENNTFLKDGINGFICKNADDFYEKITYIHELNQQDYNKMCRAARAGLPDFCVDKYIGELIHVADNLLLTVAP